MGSSTASGVCSLLDLIMTQAVDPMLRLLWQQFKIHSRCPLLARRAQWRLHLLPAEQIRQAWGNVIDSLNQGPESDNFPSSAQGIWISLMLRFSLKVMWSQTVSSSRPFRIPIIQTGVCQMPGSWFPQHVHGKMVHPVVIPVSSLCQSDVVDQALTFKLNMLKQSRMRSLNLACRWCRHKAGLTILCSLDWYVLVRPSYSTIWLPFFSLASLASCGKIVPLSTLSTCDNLLHKSKLWHY